MEQGLKVLELTSVRRFESSNRCFLSYRTFGIQFRPRVFSLQLFEFLLHENARAHPKSPKTRALTRQKIGHDQKLKYALYSVGRNATVGRSISNSNDSIRQSFESS